MTKRWPRPKKLVVLRSVDEIVVRRSVPTTIHKIVLLIIASNNHGPIYQES